MLLVVSPKKLDNFIDSNEKSMTYYTGNWGTDVADNFTEKQSEKIFKTMSKYMNNDNLQFFQRKNKNIEIGTGQSTAKTHQSP